MSGVTGLPLWAAIPFCLLIVGGAAVAAIGGIGLLRMHTFYTRLHAPGLGSSGATVLICLASILCFAVIEGRTIFHEVLVIVFVTVTTPVTLMLLGQSALYRDRIERNPDVPRKSRSADGVNGPVNPEQ